MRHRRVTEKLGRSSAHRKALGASLVCGLIEGNRITTTLPKAKAARKLADKMVTLGRKGTLPARRRAIAILRRKDRVAKLFDEVVPKCEGRNGGYTRIIKLGHRRGDGSEMAILEWAYMAPATAAAQVEPEAGDEA